MNSLLKLSKLLRPGYYEVNVYGIPVGDKENMDVGDAQATYDLLKTFEKFKFFRNVTLQENAKTLSSRVTIWENFNVK